MKAFVMISVLVSFLNSAAASAVNPMLGIDTPAGSQDAIDREFISAVEQGNVPLARRFLQLNADLNALDRSAIRTAAYRLDQPMVDFLIASGGTVPRDILASVLQYEKSPYFLSRSFPYSIESVDRKKDERVSEAVRFWLSKGADPDLQKQTECKNGKSIKPQSGRMIDMRSAVLSINKPARSLLSVAIERGFVETALVLLEAGASPSVLSADKYCRGPLSTVLMNNELTETDKRLLVERLLEKGADPDERTSHNSGGNKYLTLAARDGYVSIAKLLLDKGARLDNESPSEHRLKETALGNAVVFLRVDMVRFLLGVPMDANEKRIQIKFAKTQYKLWPRHGFTVEKSAIRKLIKEAL